MTEPRVYFDGRFVAESKATLPATSRAVLYGEGLFETFRTYGGRPFALAAHMIRLKRSADFLRVPVPADIYRAEDIVGELLKRNGMTDAVVRVSVLAGTAAGGFSARPEESHLLVIARALPRTLAKDRQHGVTAAVRPAGSLPLAAHKTTAYLRSVVATRQVAARRVREVLLADDSGNILEGATTNVYLIVRDALVTPPADGRILPGVTRQILLDIAENGGLPYREHPLTPRLLKMADGMLISNSVIEVLPVVEVDGAKIGRGRPHSLAKMFFDLYRERVAEEAG